MPDNSESHKKANRWSWLKPQFGKIAYGKWEWVVMRALFAWYCIYPTTLPGGPLSTKTQPAPNGIAQFFDLTFLAGEGAFDILKVVVPVFLIIYVIGILPFLSTTVLFLIHVALATLANSQGAIHHTGQVVGYALLGQMICHGYRWIKHILGKQSLQESSELLHRDLIYYTQQAMAAAYVVAGLSKIINSGFQWVATIPNMVLQLEKNYGMHFHNNLKEPPGRGTEFAADLIINHPTLAKILLTGGLLLELLCFLALWNRLFLAIFGASLIAMHMFISSAMNLGFAYNKAALFIFYVNAPFIAFAIYKHFFNRGGQPELPKSP